MLVSGFPWTAYETRWKAGIRTWCMVGFMMQSWEGVEVKVMLCMFGGCSSGGRWSYSGSSDGEMEGRLMGRGDQLRWKVKVGKAMYKGGLGTLILLPPHYIKILSRKKKYRRLFDTQVW